VDDEDGRRWVVFRWLGIVEGVCAPVYGQCARKKRGGVYLRALGEVSVLSLEAGVGLTA
jgi:hypothetical protein